MTEQEAKSKWWCPWARVRVTVQQNIRGMAGAPSETVAVNRNDDGTIPAGTRCLGSACSQWRWDDVPDPGWDPDKTHTWKMTKSKTDGYCGRGGAP